MSKKKKLLSMAAFAVAALMLLAAMGCGATRAALFADPMELFNNAKEEVVSADSFRMDGTVNMKMEFGSQDFDIDLGVDSIYEKTADGSWIISMDMDMGELLPSSSSAGGNVEAYVVNGKMYMKLPGVGTWVYQENKALSNISDFSNMTPESIRKMLESAKELEVVEEGEKTVTYRLALDPDKIYTPENLEMIREVAGESGVAPDKVGDYVETVKQAAANMDITVTVDKVTGLMTEMTMESDDLMGSQGFSLFSGGDLGQMEGASMSMYADFRMSGYGEDYGIELPGEARDAISVDELKALQGSK